MPDMLPALTGKATGWLTGSLGDSTTQGLCLARTEHPVPTF
jgi:hypothetical protein